MQILGDSILVLLASIGIWTIVTLTVRKAFPDVCFKGVYTIICLEGDALNAELLLRKVFKVQPAAKLFLVDYGLSHQGKEFVSILVNKYSRVKYSTLSDLDKNVKEAVKWETQSNSIK